MEIDKKSDSGKKRVRLTKEEKEKGMSRQEAFLNRPNA